LAYALAVDLNYVREGAGDPLLLVHPLGGTLTVWRPVIPLLARHRDVIAVDMPGFGGSEPLRNGVPPSPAGLAATLAAFCADLGIERPHVAGNSLGGWVALEMAKARAARSVTGISPAGLWRNPLGPRRRDSHELGRRLRPVVHGLMRTRRGRQMVLGGAFTQPGLIPAPEARGIVDGYLDSAGYAEANREMRAAVFEDEGRLTVPVTIAWGQRDRVVGRPSRSRLPPGARYVEMPAWGHVPMWDDPAGVTRLLLESSA
jgi:pimeloyl-ACP methyl ester carboxylesterase